MKTIEFISDDSDEEKEVVKVEIEEIKPKPHKQKRQIAITPDPPPPPPFIKKKPMNYTKIIVCVLLFMLYTHGIYSLVAYHYTLAQNQYKSSIVYPLNLKQHNTKSLTYNDNIDVKIPKHVIFNQLRLHLTLHPYYIVLCMHHLKIPSKFQYNRLCVLYNSGRNEFIYMENPLLIGKSTGQTTKKYIQKSISCTNETNTKRYQNVVLEWTSEYSNANIYSVFKNRESIALQMALDEFEGDIHCKH